MTPELEALECVLAEIFREVSTAARLADMAGLDVVQIDRTGSSADVWHSIITLAIQDGVLEGLAERAITERPRNKELATAWAAYQAAVRPPAQPVRRRPPPGQAGENLSDYRADARIDQLQRDMAAQMSSLQRDLAAQSERTQRELALQGEKFAVLSGQVLAITDMLQAQKRDAPSLSNSQFATIMLAFGVVAVLVFFAVWYGGNR